MSNMESRSFSVPTIHTEELNCFSVATILKEGRMRNSIDLYKASKILCIRPFYLEAIEDGRFQDLPGGIYTSSFVYMYARYLGLDSDAVLYLLKREIGHSGQGIHLHFPTPVTSNQKPTGALVSISIILAMIVYSIWLWISTTEVVINHTSAGHENFVSFQIWEQ